MKHAKSKKLLKEAMRLTPLGSQTYSKSYTQFPMPPNFLECGRGSHVKDVDGNEYIDFISALGAITLGYRDKDMETAICLQMLDGISFSLPTRLEATLAKKIQRHYHNADMVRFGKNGSDVTSAAVRLARAFTKRDHVAMCGYHGSQDWSIGVTSMQGGIPYEVKSFTHRFDYNNVSMLNTLFNNYPIACVIMEPMNSTWPVDGFLKEVKSLCRDNGSLLIFDEIVTGFRYGLGGASELFDITPDMTCLGKGIANGMPLSVLCGRKDVMRLIEQDVFMSSTFGGETLSLAAALATINKMEREPVHKKMKENGQFIMDGVKKLGFPITGHPSWSFVQFDDLSKKTLFKEECIKRGILIDGTHTMSYAHSRKDCEKLIQVYKEVLPLLKTGTPKCQTIKPIFQTGLR